MSQLIPNDAIVAIFGYLPWSDKARLCFLNRRVANRLIPRIDKERQRLIKRIELAHEESRQLRLTQLYPAINRLSVVKDQLDDEYMALWDRVDAATDEIDEGVIAAASATDKARLAEAEYRYAGKVLAHVTQLEHFDELAARITDDNILHLPRRPIGPMQQVLIEVSGCVLTAAFEIEKTLVSIEIASSGATMVEQWGRAIADAVEVDDVDALEVRRRNAAVIAHISTLYPQVLDCAQRKRDVEERLFDCFKQIHASMRRVMLLMVVYNQLQIDQNEPVRGGRMELLHKALRKLAKAVKSLF